MIKKRISYNIRLLVVLIAAVISLAPMIFILTNSFMGAMEAEARYTSIITPHSVLGVTAGDA